MTRSSSRSPYGERGLKSIDSGEMLNASCRSPYGERGLKYNRLARWLALAAGSLSLRRAWIEINRLRARLPYHCVALLTESVD